MAKVVRFRAWRYADKAGPLGALVTQPYDNITPEMRARYLAWSPYNLVRVILGETYPTDSPADNVYTRAACHLRNWIAAGVLARDEEPSLFSYFQEFTDPDSGERLVRRGFIGLGAVEDYSAGVVRRHEQTLSGPKQDRLELLRHTRAHFGQIFMLYPDPAGQIDALLDGAACTHPIAEVTDEYGAVHRLWRIAEPARIQALMADKKLLIADGHHRYETALAFRNENPELEDARRVMMTFVNMYSPGLKILATHRLVSGLAGFEPRSFLERASERFRVEPVATLDALRARWTASDSTVIGAAMGDALYALEARDRAESLDVRVLHTALIAGILGIGEEAVKDERHIRYIRGLDAAVAEARRGAAQIAFLLKPVSVEQVARISFAGGVMPQKSTDFYPKLLSGLTIYRLER